MSVMFFGADAGRKRTALIEAFVRVRLPGLLKLRTRNFRATLQSEIAQISTFDYPKRPSASSSQE